MWIMIYISLDIDLIHGDVYGQSCKNLFHSTIDF